MLPATLSQPFRHPAYRPICAACSRRQFSASSVLGVRRPQEPYDMPKPFIDPDGYNRDVPREEKLPLSFDTRRHTYLGTLSEIADSGSKTWYEKYGTHEGYGLKNKRRYRIGEEGKLEPWHAAGENWKEALGFYTVKQFERLGGIPGFQRRDKRLIEKRRQDSYSDRTPRISAGAQDEGDVKARVSEEQPTDTFRASVRFEEADHEQPSASDDHNDARSQSHYERLDERSYSAGSSAQPVHRPITPPMARRGAARNSANYASNFGLPKTGFGARQYSTIRSVREVSQEAIPDNGVSQSQEGDFDDMGRRPWRPAKKLSYSAMAGLKELHRSDPQKYDRKYLSQKFGISFEAVSRILKSSWRARPAPNITEARPVTQVQALKTETGTGLRGTKWDPKPGSSPQHSAVAVIMRANGN